MDNIDVAGTLAFYAKLAELHEQNPYKIKAYAAAAFNLRKVKQPLQSMTQPEVEAIPGVGKSVSKAIVELAGSSRFPELEALERETPPGVLEMLHIKGLGPKKVHIIWKSMGLLSVEALWMPAGKTGSWLRVVSATKPRLKSSKPLSLLEPGKEACTMRVPNRTD